MTTRIASIIVVLLLTVGFTPAWGDAALDAEVLKKLEALEKEVQDLRKSNAELRGKVSKYEHGDGWLNARRAEEIKALVHDVLADADTRASLMADGAVAGHDGQQFFLASADGGFRLNIGGQIQFRYVYNNRDRTSGDGDEFGFDLRRVKLNFSGQINSGPTFLYDVGLQVTSDDQEVNLDHAKIGHRLSDQLVIWAGEDKAWFLREEMVHSSRLLTVDRSLFNEAFTLGRIQGVWIVYQPDDMFRLYGSINDGLRSGEANGAGGFETSNRKDFDDDVVDIAFTGRVDVKIMGDWAQLKDFSAWSGEPTGLFVGGAVHYQIAETGDDQDSGDDLDFPNSGGEHDAYVTWTLDISAECSGATVFAAIAGTHVDSAAAGNGSDHYGAMVQVGYMVIPDKLEPFFRVEWLGMEDEGSLGDTPADVTLLTFGANWYIKRHAAKFSVDILYALHPIEAQNIDQHPIAVIKEQELRGLGLLRDDSDQDSQFVIRAQFQLLF